MLGVCSESVSFNWISPPSSAPAVIWTQWGGRVVEGGSWGLAQQETLKWDVFVISMKWGKNGIFEFRSLWLMRSKVCEQFFISFKSSCSFSSCYRADSSDSRHESICEPILLHQRAKQTASLTGSSFSDTLIQTPKDKNAMNAHKLILTFCCITQELNQSANTEEKIETNIVEIRREDARDRS